MSYSTLKNFIHSDYQDDRGKTHLMYSIVYNDIPKIEYLIELSNIHGMNLQDLNGNTALMISCSLNSNIDIIKLLLDAGSNPNITGCNGTTALMMAIGFSLESSKLLLDYGADPNIQDNSGYTALLYACHKGTDYIKLLLDYGAKPNLKSIYGHAALIIASIYKWDVDYLVGIKYLLEAGGDPNIVGYNMKTAYDVANLSCQNIIIEFQKQKYLNYKTRDILAGKFPNKDVGKIILLMKDYMLFSGDANNYIGELWGMIELLNIPLQYNAKISKHDLCLKIKQKLFYN